MQQQTSPQPNTSTTWTHSSNVVPSQMTNATNTPDFECRWCHKTFKREHSFLQHKCKHMLKNEELRSPIGQAALEYYKMWFAAQGRSVVAESTFAASKMYSAFIRFAKFARDVSLPMPSRYITIMAARRIEPSSWTSDESYVMYLEYLDNNAPPTELVSMTVKTILSIAQKLEIDTSQVFVTLNAQEIITFIQKRKLSPWVLLLSPTFLKMVKSANAMHAQVFKTLIPPASWHKRLSQNPAIVTAVRQYVAALGI